MRTLFTIAALSLATAMVGCNNNSTAPGAVSGHSHDGAACCGACGDAAPGAVSSEKASCESSCATSCDKMTTAAPGAVSSESSTGCPFSGAGSSNN